MLALGKMLFFLFALFISCTVARPDASRIVGGLPASEGQFKYLAQVKYVVDGHYLATFPGSIISYQWILTSAAIYVIDAKPEYLTAIVGTTKIDNNSGWGYDVSEIIVHPNVSRADIINNNIAVVKVDGHIMLGGNVATIFLSSSTRIPPHLSFSFASWGVLNSTSGINSATLQYITLNTIDMTECRKLLPKHHLEFDDATHFCTAPLAGNGPCNGDMGAPLVYGDYQIGLDVTSISCYYNGLPTVFLKIGVYRKWIMEVTGGLK